MYSWDRGFPKRYRAKPWVVQTEFCVLRPSVKLCSVYVASLPRISGQMEAVERRAGEGGPQSMAL